MFLLSTKPMPLIPFFWDGLLAVYVFFVLSGYVLSIGFIEKRNASILTSLATRRYPRLTIPVFASCLLAYVLVHTGCMVNHDAGALAVSPWLESFYRFDATIPSLLTFSLWRVYTDPTADSYNAVLWTMQYELWGSLVLLASLYVLRGWRARVVGYTVATIACVAFDSPYFAFAIGAALADGSVQLERFASGALARASAAIAWLVLAIALVIAAMRQGWLGTPIAMSIYAGAIVLCILLSKPLQAALTTRLSQFIGRLSFPLYLTHLLVICSWSSWLYAVLHQAGFGQVATGIAVAASTVVLAILAALAFSPVETFALRASRALWTTVSGRQRAAQQA